MIDLKELKRLARQAIVSDGPMDIIDFGKIAEYHLAVDPATVIDLLNAIEAADEIIDRLHGNGEYHRYWFVMDAYMEIRGTLPKDHWKLMKPDSTPP